MSKEGAIENVQEKKKKGNFCCNKPRAATARSAEASLRRSKIGEKKVKYCAFFAAIIIESRTAVFTPPVPRVGSSSSSSISGESLRWGNRCLSHIQVPPRQQPKNPRKERTNIRWEEVQLSREIKGGVVVYEPLEEINAPVLSCVCVCVPTVSTAWHYVEWGPTYIYCTVVRMRVKYIRGDLALL